ncbi:Transcriptional regulator [Fructobacillus tropaeoli]|uniref:helix-turn-helix domain-containing protein n=1 Tax=Fructobacillus tropaeoli TaxID=709323 RepID=UPI002DA061C6|nr:Transcriptional regulator [Fructobacillus tropaeoli]
MSKNRLKGLRKEKGYTLNEIAQYTGITRSTCNDYENGKTEPKLATWEKLAKFYGVEPAYLVGWNDER